MVKSETETLRLLADECGDDWSARFVRHFCGNCRSRNAQSCRRRKGGEDSVSVLAALRGEAWQGRPPLLINDHVEEKEDQAAGMIRVDHPTVDGKVIEGQWKLFFDAKLFRFGEANPLELYDLATDPMEANDRLAEPELKPLVDHLTALALLHRRSGGHRLARMSGERFVFPSIDEAEKISGSADGERSTAEFSAKGLNLKMTISGSGKFSPNPRGLGLESPKGKFGQVDGGESLQISFDRDVILESVSIVVGNGVCGGHYRVGDSAKRAIYATDADNDYNDQTGNLSDLGFLKAGTVLHLESTPHFKSEPKGRWRLGEVAVRLVHST